jgi:uncharacterized protein YqeY
MSLQDDVGAAIATAMKARDQLTLGTLRMLKSALTMKAVEKGRELDDRESLQVVATLVKQRRESIDQFTKGGRPELAQKEAAEIRVLERYLPPAASADEIEAAVQQAIADTGASSAKELGAVMKAAMARLGDRSVDGKTVNETARRLLAQRA